MLTISAPRRSRKSSCNVTCSNEPVWSYQSPCLSPGFRCGPSHRFEVVLEDLCHHKHGSSWISRSSMRRRDPDMLLAPWMLNCKQPERSAYWTSLSFLRLRSLRGFSGPGCNFDAGLRSETQRAFTSSRGYVADCKPSRKLSAMVCANGRS